MSEGGILVVGRQRDLTSQLAAELRESELGEIKTFESAEAAFKQLETDSPKAIICDIEGATATDIDGFQFCRLLKSAEHPEFNHIPVVLYSTGRIDLQFEQLAKDVGAALFLNLPEQQGSLVSALGEIFTPAGAVRRAGGTAQAPAEARRGTESLSKVLVVEDDRDTLLNVRTALESEGYRVFEAGDGEEAIEKVGSLEPRVVLLDYRIPKKDGMTVLGWIKRNKPATAVVVMTAYGSEVLAVDLMKAGADDYVRKPFEIADILSATARAMRKYGIRLVNIQFQESLSEIEKLRTQVQARYGLENIIGSSKPMGDVFELVGKVAPTEANILITGESGTGKELIARALHAKSHRAKGAFVPVDCASLSETLLESELFGHEKGAFTGAHRTRPGLLEHATGGTFFMDEVGKMPFSTQSKFLRVLQEKSVRRLGGNEQIPVDVRVVAATNLDIDEAVKSGQFREDLYYRLNVVRIHLPSLREHREDIPLLVQHFLRKFADVSPRPVEGISPEAMILLEAYNWPGNVRELENTIERAISLTDTPVIGKEVLPLQIRSQEFTEIPSPSDAASFKEAKDRWIEVFEKKYLSDLLKRHNYNISAAAREAGINRKTIHRLIEKHGLRQS
jgi:DNA-binding NtrC family response regulator